MQTREQVYAASVYTHVQNLLRNHPDHKQTYGSMAHKLPVLIRTAGLAQALAFVTARGDTGQQQLLKDLAAALKSGAVLDSGSVDTLLSTSRSASIGDYMWLTQEALQALLWFKRFAQSELDIDASTEGGSV